MRVHPHSRAPASHAWLQMHHSVPHPPLKSKRDWDLLKSRATPAAVAERRISGRLWQRLSHERPSQGSLQHGSARFRGTMRARVRKQPRLR